ncbi:MAG: hypothetical protein IJ224_05815 [Lachnospiraceae bacterium]|nr:hypothetical protein [Lachnospiraceae bacterium]
MDKKVIDLFKFTDDELSDEELDRLYVSNYRKNQKDIGNNSAISPLFYQLSALSVCIIALVFDRPISLKLLIAMSLFSGAALDILYLFARLMRYGKVNTKDVLITVSAGIMGILLFIMNGSGILL